MNAAESQTLSRPSAPNQEPSNIKGENEMNAAVARTQNTIATVYQNILNLPEFEGGNGNADGIRNKKRRQLAISESLGEEPN